MSDLFVGDNDHGDAVPPTDVLLEMIKTLRAERDEARRMYCEAVNRHHVRLDAFGIAKNHGWDCYKDRADD